MKGFMNTGREGDRRVKGFTMLELMITLMVVAIAVALAVPSFENINQKRQTTSQAEELASFLAFAHSEAVKMNEPVSVSLVHNNANSWCIGANEGTGGCDCEETNTAAANYCSIDGVAVMMGSSTQPKSSMSAHSADTTFAFDPVRGILDTADLGQDHEFRLQSDNGKFALQVDIGPTGKVRVCNPDATKEVPGFDLCTQPVVIVLPPSP